MPFILKDVVFFTALDVVIQYGVPRKIRGVKIGRREAPLVEKLLWLLLEVHCLV